MERFRFRPNARLGTYKFSASGILETTDQNIIKELSEHKKVEWLTRPVKVTKTVEEKTEENNEKKENKRNTKKTQ